MKSTVRFGLLGLFIALAVAFGVTQLRGGSDVAEAQAQGVGAFPVGKNCVGAVGTFPTPFPPTGIAPGAMLGPTFNPFGTAPIIAGKGAFCVVITNVALVPGDVVLTINPATAPVVNCAGVPGVTTAFLPGAALPPTAIATAPDVVPANACAFVALVPIPASTVIGFEAKRIAPTACPPAAAPVEVTEVFTALFGTLTITAGPIFQGQNVIGPITCVAPFTGAKECIPPPATAPTPQTFTCFFRITLVEGLPAGAKLVKRLTPETNAIFTGPPTVTGAGTCPVGALALETDFRGYEAIIDGGTPLGFPFFGGTAGCPPGSTIVFSEPLTIVAPGGTDVCQTVNIVPAFFPTGTGEVLPPGGFTAAGPFCAGIRLPGAAPTPTPIGGVNAFKQCNVPATTATTTFTCTLTITTTTLLPAGTAIVVNLVSGPGATTAPNVTFIDAAVVFADTVGCATTGTIPLQPGFFGPQPGGDGTGQTGAFEIFTGNCPPGSRIIIAETLQIIGTGGGQFCQVVSFPKAPAPGFASATSNCFTLPTMPAAVSTIAGVSKVCTPIVDGVPAPTTTATNVGNIFVRVGQTVTCTVTITSAAGAAAFAGPVTVNLGTTGTFAGTTVGTGTTATFTAVPVTPATTPATATFTEVFVPTTPCITLTQTVTVSGAPFTVPVVGTVGTTTNVPIFVLPKLGTGVVCPPVGGLTFVQPVAIAFDCETPAEVADIVGDPVIAAVPGEIAGTFVAAIGVLPAPLTCKAVPVPAHCTAAEAITAARARSFECAVAPGTIEISSINGTLIDASGALTTNLRIGCGEQVEPTLVFPGIGATGITGAGVLVGTGTTTAAGIINLNTCIGVTFAVAGFGVGFVELRARYEPSTVAAAAGIQEVEGRTEVAFVAPALAALGLTLVPNPVAPGQTGTATVTFAGGTPIPCSRGTVIFFCVDPNTGLPLTIGLGSQLSGEVIFEIDNTNVAFWLGAGPAGTAAAIAGTGQTVQQVAQATQLNRIAVRCGPATTAVTTAATTAIGTTVTALQPFFAGCTSASAIYQGNTPGTTTVRATFIPDLPGAFGGTVAGVPARFAALLGTFRVAGPATASATLVVSGPPTGVIQLVRGCNNVTPTVTEDVAAFAARVSPAANLVAIWEHQAATNTFRGFSPMPGAPNDLATVTRLRPVFICVTGPATLTQPPA